MWKTIIVHALASFFSLFFSSLASFSYESASLRASFGGVHPHPLPANLFIVSADVSNFSPGNAGESCSWSIVESTECELPGAKNGEFGFEVSILSPSLDWIVPPT